MTDANNNELQETKSSRRSLDFSNNAEKPFVDGPQTQRKEATIEVLESASAEQGKARKVQFEAKASDTQNAKTNIAEDTLRAEIVVDQNHRSSSHEDQHFKRTGLSPKTGDQKEESRRGDTRCDSPQRYTDHLRILAYLVGELRAILASTGTV